MVDGSDRRWAVFPTFRKKLDKSLEARRATSDPQNNTARWEVYTCVPGLFEEVLHSRLVDNIHAIGMQR